MFPYRFIDGGYDADKHIAAGPFIGEMQKRSHGQGKENACNCVPFQWIQIITPTVIYMMARGNILKIKIPIRMIPPSHKVAWSGISPAIMKPRTLVKKGVTNI